MKDLDTIHALYVRANALEHDIRYMQACDAFLVLADAVEAHGEPEEATRLRRRALRNYVTAWARQRWPREGIHVFNVDFAQSSSYARKSRVDLVVRRRDVERWEYVSVGRRGDVRVEEADLGGGRGRVQEYRTWTGYERQPWQRW